MRQTVRTIRALFVESLFLLPSVLKRPKSTCYSKYGGFPLANSLENATQFVSKGVKVLLLNESIAKRMQVRRTRKYLVLF